MLESAVFFIEFHKYRGKRVFLHKGRTFQRAADNMNLSEQQLAQFRSDGYLVIKKLVPKRQCEAMLDVTQQQLKTAAEPVEYETELGYPGAPASFDAPGGKTIRRLRAAYQRDACFRHWAEDPDQVARLQQLLGEAVCLTLAHHNCVMTKHPHFGTATGWHRDIRYWSYSRPELVVVWLALGPENAQTGGLRFIPGSHRQDIAPHQLDALDFLRPDVADNFPLFAAGRQVEQEQGDVVFFHSKLFHAAGRNDGDMVKTSVAFAYRGVSNLPLPGSRSAAAGEVDLSK